MKISCLVVDDEQLARRLLCDYIAKIPTLTLVGSCANALEAQVVLQSQQVDLMFLDIQMPELTGIAFLQSLTHKPVTIFTTAYTEYAIKGFELAVLDYLVKPISFERFFQAATRAIGHISNIPGSHKNDGLSDQPIFAGPAAAEDFIFVKSDFRIHKLHFSDIDYIEAYGEYILIFAGKDKIITLVPLGKMEAQLPARLFIRVHRSYIVNFSKIESIQGNTIYLKGKEIPISKSYREVFMNLVNRNQLF